MVSDVGHIIPCNIASIKRPGEVCACLGCYTVHVASCLLMMWDSMLVLSATVKQSKKNSSCAIETNRLSQNVICLTTNLCNITTQKSKGLTCAQAKA